MNNLITSLLKALVEIAAVPHNTVAVREISMRAVIDAKDSLEAIGKRIRYPELWDTAAYPKLSDALHEISECAILCCDTDPTGFITDSRPLVEEAFEHAVKFGTCVTKGRKIVPLDDIYKPADIKTEIPKCPSCGIFLGPGPISYSCQKAECPCGLGPIGFL